MTENGLSANFPVPGSVSTSEPRTGGSVEAGHQSDTVAMDPGERILVGQDRTDGRRGLVQISADGNELVVGVNPNGHPFSWSLAVITREHATALRDWLDQQLAEVAGGNCCANCEDVPGHCASSAGCLGPVFEDNPWRPS